MTDPAIFKTAYYNSGALTHSALVQETEYLSHSFVHEFFEPARVVVTLNDDDGSIMQKYGTKTNEVYVFSGRAYIEVDSVSKFDGRIVKVVGDMDNNRVIIYAEDWMGQLGKERINYGMREDMDGTGLRQSNLKSDLDGAKFPVTKNFIAAVKTYDSSTTTYADFIIEASETTEDDVELFPGPVGDEDHFYMGFDVIPSGVTINVTTAGNNEISVRWYYSKGGGEWGELANMSPVNDSPSQQFEVTGKIEYSWDVPGDWATDTVDGDTHYWVRVRVRGFSTATTQPLGAYITQGGIVYDDDMSWAADLWNGYYVVIPHAMAGKQTISTGPYDETIDIVLDTTDSPAAGEINVWDDDDIFHEMEDANNDWLVTYDFRIPILESELYVADSISAMRVNFVHSLESAAPVGAITDLSIRNTPNFVYLQRAFVNEGDFISVVYRVPFDEIAGILVDPDPQILIQTGTVAAATNLKVTQVVIEVDVETTGYPDLMLIEDTFSNYLVVSKDVEDLGLWENCEYSICREIHYHIDGLVTGGDDLMTMTTNVEATTRINTRQYTERTRLEIIKDNARMDKAVCWVPPGTKELNYKSTFNDGAPDPMTDADVLHWRSEYVGSLMRNEMHVKGIRIRDEEIALDTEDLAVDPGSDSKLKYGLKTTQVITNTGTMSYADAVTLGTNLVERDEDIHLFLDAVIAGPPPYELADEVSITSAYLGITAQVYVITHVSYDSNTWRTTLRLHPRVSNGFVNRVVFGEFLRDLAHRTTETVIDTFVAGLISQESTND